MSQANFSSVLDKPSTDVGRPKPLPVGSYITVVQGLPKIDKSSKKQTEYSEYSLKVLQAGEDVDADDLDTALTKASGEKLNLLDKVIRITFYHTEDSLWRLKQFFEHLNIPEEDDDGETLTMRQRMQLVPNRQVGVYVKHVASEDGESVFANADKTFKVE